MKKQIAYVRIHRNIGIVLLTGFQKLGTYITIQIQYVCLYAN
jgi:hypothetical protein